MDGATIAAAGARESCYVGRVRVVLAVVLALWGCKKSDGISRELGASCDSHADCADTCLPEPRWPGGFCSLDCVETSSCPVGSDCVTTGDGKVCLFLCFDDRDCAFLEAAGELRAEWSCRDVDGARVCAPAGS
jgi:hypothetical protein